MLMKQYKKHKILKENGIIIVESPNKSRFVVALDDSKANGRKSFINKYNNVKSAEKYVDWLFS